MSNKKKRKRPLFGPTGLFPRGKLRSDDEGELKIGVTRDGATVVIAFGKLVSWVGMPADTARRLAQSLLEKADEASISIAPADKG